MSKMRFKKTAISISLAAVMAVSFLLPSSMPVFADDIETVEETVEVTEVAEEETAEEIAEEEETAEVSEVPEETTVEEQGENPAAETLSVVTTEEKVPVQEVSAQSKKEDVVTTSVMVDVAFEETAQPEKKTPVLFIDEKKTMYGDTTGSLSMYLENAQEKNVRWRSSDTSIAEVDENGVITAKNSGECKIIAWVKGTTVKAVCRLKVIRFRVMTVTATAYCACARCCGKSDGITATGTHAKQGRTIAVDPRMIPLGSKVQINGHTYIAEDVGGGIKSNRIDIFFNNHYDALVFGRRTMTIKVFY